MEPAGTRTLAQVARDSWSTPCAHRHKPILPGLLIDTVGTGPGPESPGQRVKTAVPRTQLRIVWDSWSTSRGV